MSLLQTLNMKLHAMLLTRILQIDVLKMLGNFQKNMHDGVRSSKFTDFEIKINFETLKKFNRPIHDRNLAKKSFLFPQKLQYRLH